MSQYNSSANDVIHTCKSLIRSCHLDEVSEFKKVNIEKVSKLVKAAAEFSGRQLQAINSKGDVEGCTIENGHVKVLPEFVNAYKSWVKGEWSSISADSNYGGQSLPKLVSCAANECFIAGNLSFSQVIVLSQIVVQALTDFGSENQKQLFLRKLISGRWTGTLNIFESKKCTDLGKVNAERSSEGNHYLLRGEQQSINWGDHGLAENIIHLVLALSPTVKTGELALSLFIVPKFLVGKDGEITDKNDMQVVSIEETLGDRASPSCVLNLGANSGAVGYLVGEEGQGEAYMESMMECARLGISLQSVGVSEAAYQQALKYSKVENAIGVARINRADTRRMLMHMRALTEGARVMCYYAYAQADLAADGRCDAAALRLDLITPLVKVWTSAIASEVASLGIQVHGYQGCVEGVGAAQYYRDARVLSVLEGANGIHALDFLVTNVIADSANEIKRMMYGMRTDAYKFQRCQADISDMGLKLMEAIMVLQSSIDWVLSQKDNQDNLESVAYDFLMLAGYVSAGSLLCDKAMLSSVTSPKSDDEVDYLAASISVANFYMNKILPRVHAHWSAIRSGAEDINSLSLSQF